MAVPKLEGITTDTLGGSATLAASAEVASPPAPTRRSGRRRPTCSTSQMSGGLWDWQPARRACSLAHVASVLIVRPTAVAEQFVLDVSAVTDEQRAELRDAETTRPCWSTCFTRSTWCFGCGQWPTGFRADPHYSAVPEPGVSLPETLNLVTGLVARLVALGPLTTELVRLRGDRRHNCRM